jgi:hypothetical protein
MRESSLAASGGINENEKTYIYLADWNIGP